MAEHGLPDHCLAGITTILIPPWLRCQREQACVHGGGSGGQGTLPAAENAFSFPLLGQETAKPQGLPVAWAAGRTERQAALPARCAGNGARQGPAPKNKGPMRPWTASLS